MVAGSGCGVNSRTYTGIAGTTTWSTEAAEQRIHEWAEGLQRRPGRGADRRVGDAVIQILEAYEAYVNPLPVGDRPCFVGTLLGYPGALYGGALKYDPHKIGKNKKRRVGEIKHPGSKRFFLRPDTRDLIERLTPYGFVLEHQLARTRPASTPVHQKDDPEQRGTRTGRPLTDVLLTAIVLATRRPLLDDPLRDIERQLLRQETAQQLWNIASRHTSDNTPAQQRRVLVEALPRLLVDDNNRLQALRHMLPTWSGTLIELVDSLDQLVGARPQGYQLMLLSDAVPL
jgi:hypothetical protein